MEPLSGSPLAVKPVLNRFHRSLPPPEASDYQVCEWLNTWLGRESRTLHGALLNIDWDGKKIRELTKEAMVYEIDRGFRALENFHHLDDSMKTAEGLAADIQSAKDHDARRLLNGTFHSMALVHLLLTLVVFILGYTYAIVWELGIEWDNSDHALRLSVIILSLTMFIRIAHEEVD